MSRRTSLPVALAVLAAGAALAPRAASAQSTGQLALHVELGAGTMLPDHQVTQQDYGLALTGAARLGLHLVGPVAVQVSGAYWHFPSDAGDGFATTVTGGLRLEPRLGRVGRVFLDGNVGAAFTGDDLLTRLAFDAGLGFEFALAGPVHLGPMVRYGHILAGDADVPSDAQFWMAGLSLGLHPSPSRGPSGPADADLDGVLDPDDACVREPAGDHPDPARRGCPLRDADRDGVLDPDDACVNEPAGDRPDPARRGCPSRDADGDGILDGADACPTEPRGASPDPERAGCPDGDDDHDGVLNHADACRQQRPGPVPDPARPGCPAPDRDHDSVPDATDHCPDRPGAPHPDPDRNGCPGLVLVEGGQVRINRPVFFATSRDTILPRSNAVLQAVADALRATPSIRRVSIEGHTDDVGDDARNLDLSERRANSVLRWLTSHGVEAERLEAHGFGETRPTRPLEGLRGRAQRDARAANRRVEFRIADPAPEPVSQ